MKKFVVTIVLLCYLAVSSGVIINFHYCMDRLASAEWYAPQPEKCGNCGMDIHESNGCCRDEVQVVKLDDDQKVNYFAGFDFSNLAVTARVPSEYMATPFWNEPVNRHHQNHSPPLLSAQDTYLQNSVFRI